MDEGSGGWWKVDVILRPPEGSGDLHNRLPEIVRAALPDVHDVPSVIREPEQAYSFDMSPPEGNLGVAVWVRAPDVGSAVEAAWKLVASCMRELHSEHPPELWDLRVMPMTAVLEESVVSAAAAPLMSRRKRRWWRYR